MINLASTCRTVRLTEQRIHLLLMDLLMTRITRTIDLALEVIPKWRSFCARTLRSRAHQKKRKKEKVIMALATLAERGSMGGEGRGLLAALKA